MRVEFRNRRLEQCYLRSSLAVREFGPEIGRRYIQRVNMLKAVDKLADLRLLPGLRCHPLKGERAGLWAINLNGFYRLLFSWTEGKVEIVTIEEVRKYYGD